MNYKISDALDWQRSKARKIIHWINNKDKWYNQNISKHFTDWYSDVFNLDTATDFGLYMWALILDIPLYGVHSGSTKDFEAIGFNDNTSTSSAFYNFTHGGFGLISGDSFGFTTEQDRIALKLKAYILCMNGSCRDINRHLAIIFGEGNVYAIDNLDMTLDYVVSSEELYEFAIALKHIDILPRPSGVQINNITQISKDTNTFGFEENNANFDKGNFEQ